jgi:hypothetical protein
MICSSGVRGQESDISSNDLKMKERILKRRYSGAIGMLLGGAFLAYLGFGCAVLIKDIYFLAIIPGIFGVLGVLWIVTATAILLSRNRLFIRINEAGIEIPMGTPFRKVSGLFISRSRITSIEKYDSLRCRGIEIKLTDGSRAAVQIRHYCEIKDFLAHCKEMELPC